MNLIPPSSKGMGTKFQCGMCLIDIFVKRLIYYTSRETHAHSKSPSVVPTPKSV